MAGLEAGMLIQEVDRTPVTNVDEFKAEVRKESKKGSILMLVRSKNYTQYVVINLK
jgi:hypothetical protein